MTEWTVSRKRENMNTEKSTSTRSVFVRNDLAKYEQ